MNYFDSLNYPLFYLSYDYFFNDFSTSFSWSLNSYFINLSNLSNARFNNMLYGFNFWLFDFFFRIFLFFKPMSIAIFPGYDIIFLYNFDGFCYNIYYYILFYSPIIAKYYLFLPHVPFILFSKIQCFIEDDIICNFYIKFIAIKRWIYIHCAIYFFSFLCTWKITFVFIFKSTVTYKSVFLFFINYSYSALTDLIIQPVIYPLWDVLIFLYKNFFFLIYDFSYFIFQPAFFKLCFYYWWWCCLGSLPDNFIYFLSSYIGPFFIFIFKYTEFIFSAIYYSLFFLYYLPFYFDALIYFIIVDSFKLIVLLLLLPIKLFFSLFNSDIVLFSVIYNNYNCAIIFITDYFLKQCCFYLFIFFKMFVFCLVLIIRFFWLVYILTWKIIMSNFIYYYPDYWVGHKPISINLNLNLDFSAFTYLTISLQMQYIHIKWFFKWFFYLIYTYIDYALFFLLKCTSPIFIFFKYYFIIFYNFILKYYGGFYSFRYCFILSFVIHLSCIIYVSYDVCQPISARLVYTFTNRLCIIYILCFLPILIFKYYLMIYGFDIYYADFVDNVLFTKKNFLVSINIIVFLSFVYFSFILKILKLRDNIFFLLLNFFILSHVIGLFWCLTGCDYFRELVCVYDNLMVTRWVFAGNIMIHAIRDYWDFAPGWVLGINMCTYSLSYIYFLYLISRIIYGLLAFYEVADTCHRFILKYDSVFFYGVRSLNELIFFQIDNENMKSELMREILLRTQFERGWDLSYLYDEPGFVIELYRVAKARLFREYMKKIEKYTIENLDKDKMWYPMFDTSEFKSSNLIKEEIEFYSAKLKVIDPKEFLEWDNTILFNFFNIRPDENILEKVTFVNITITGLKINYSDSLVTWEKDSNAVWSTIVFKIKGRYNCCFVQEFFADEFLFTTYCIHVMKILKGDLRIWGDWRKMKFYFTRYFNLSPEIDNIYSPGHHYDMDFSYIFLNFFNEEAFNINFEDDTYMYYIWREGDSRTVLDYLGYYSNKDEFFFLTIFYKNNSDTNFETFEDYGVVQPSVTKFLKDEYTDISFPSMSDDFSLEVTAPTTQELEDENIHIRQWGYDHRLDYKRTEEKQDAIIDELFDSVYYILYVYNRRIIKKKVELLLPYFNNDYNLLSNSIFINKVQSLELHEILPIRCPNLEFTGTEYSKFNRLILDDLIFAINGKDYKN